MTWVVLLLFLVPVLHPLLIPVVGVPSHLLWFVHVLPVAMATYGRGRKLGAAAIGLSVALVVVGEKTFGAGYGRPADWETAIALAVSLGFTNLLVAGFALYARRMRWDYNSLFERGTVGILRTDRDGRIDAVNPVAVEILDRPIEELRGQRVGEVVPVPEEAIGSLEFESRTSRDDGVEVVLDVAIVPPGREGVEGDHVLIRDATGRKRLETELRHSQKMEAIGRLAGGIAHDFNNLLTVIRGYTQMLLERASPDDPEDAPVREIHDAAERAAALTDRLLTFSRRGASAQEEVDLNGLVEGIEGMVDRLVGDDVRVETDLEPDLPAVVADPRELEQVIVNLAINARDAMPQGGTITIATGNFEADPDEGEEIPRGSVRLTVADEGIGMDEATRARVFEPFFTTKGKGEGTGLGLSTVYGIIEQSGGAIRVESRPGEGSAFHILLPPLTSRPSSP
ncbi:MAG: ATP-binding protein [Gemmatimonadota bacterium]|nr:ATP-binding protein [Gemmatimonadota bacterium]